MILNSQLNFELRSGQFDYAKFTKHVSLLIEVGQSIRPCVYRETLRYGNQDSQAIADKALRESFSTQLGNRSSFRRKRCDLGGYEYIRMS